MAEQYRVIKAYNTFKIGDVFEGTFIKGTGKESNSINDVDHISSTTGKDIPVSYVEKIAQADMPLVFNAVDYKFTYIGSSIGTIVGLVYAFTQKKRFWGYVGFMILGSIVFGTAGRIIDYSTKKK